MASYVLVVLDGVGPNFLNKGEAEPLDKFGLDLDVFVKPVEEAVHGLLVLPLLVAAGLLGVGQTLSLLPLDGGNVLDGELLDSRFLLNELVVPDQLGILKVRVGLEGL